MSDVLIGDIASVTLNATSVTVTFTTALPDTNYRVTVAPNWPTPYAVGSFTVSGFAVAFAVAAPTNAVIYWNALRGSISGGSTGGSTGGTGGTSIPAVGNPWNTVPSSNSTFIADLQTFLYNEDAQRFADMFSSFVVTGGVISTGAGLTKTPTSLQAYPGGYRITEIGSITFLPSVTTFVIVHRDTSGNAGTYTRVIGTHYLIDSVSGSEPALPANSARIATVVTNTTSVTVVTDRRVLLPTGPLTGGTGLTTYAAGDMVYAPTANPLALARLADVAIGNVIVSGGVGVAPAYGKVNVDRNAATTHIAGTMRARDGGTGQSAPPTSGQSIFGNLATGDFVLGSFVGTHNVIASYNNGVGWTFTDAILAESSFTPGSYTNSTAETAKVTATFAANAFVSGAGTVEGYMDGTHTNASGGDVIYTIRLKLGVTTLCSIAFTSTNGSTSKPYSVSFKMQSGAATQSGSLTLSVDGTTPLIVLGTGAESTTVSKDLTITIQANTATSGAAWNIALHAVKYIH
jgi:hypothetical protein